MISELPIFLMKFELKIGKKVFTNIYHKVFKIQTSH